MLTKIGHLFFISYCLLFSINIIAQNNKPLPYSISYYNTKQGLPQNQVLDIIEGKNGMIVSTINGIVFYNGSEFLSFVPNENLKMDIYVKLRYNKKTEELYGWTSNGNYCRITPNHQKIETYSCVSMQEQLLVGMKRDGTIEVSSHDTKIRYSTLKTDIENPISIVQHEDNFFVSTQTHLYKVNKYTGEKQIVLNGYFNILQKNPINNEIIAVNGDVFFIQDNTIRKIQLVNTPTTTELFRDIEFLNQNEILIASSRGLYHVKNKSVDFYNESDESTLGSLYSIYYHKAENCVFIGTENNGLMMLKPLKTKTYYTDSKTNNSQSFTSIIKDKSGAIYATASKGDIIQINNGIKKNYLFIDKHVACLAYIDEKIYVGSWGSGVTIYKNGVQIDSIKLPILPSLHVQCIFKDSKNNIWIGTSQGIVRQSPSKQYKTILTKCTVISAYELKNGNICFGTTDGVFIMDKEGNLIRHLNKEQGLNCREVRSFYEDAENRLWIGTYRGGLYVYDSGKLVSINSMRNCALNQDVFTLAKHDGLFYISSNQGIWSVSEQRLYDFYKGSISYLIPQYYGEEVGIKNTEFNGGFQNNYLKSGNKLYFPSIDGAVELTIDSPLTFRKLNPKFKSVIINDTISASTNLFDRSTHTVQFNFYCPSYSEQYNIYYQYKLEGEGLPSTWSKLQKETSVNLKMLPPGHYTFSVRGLDSFNDVRPTVLSYSFSIKPFFYETLWFKIVIWLFVVISIILLVRYRIRKNKAKNTMIELKLKAIQSRMNPHFMFNSLNNIIYLLNIEKYEEAEQLLQDFSLLMRRFLEKSDSSFLTIQEELEMQQLYLAIQQKRYNYSFDFIIECPDELLKIKIPSMLIQPFVENAIIHGVAHSENTCQISISVNKKGNQLTIEIKDNGIGRIKSMKINSSRQNHISHGIALVKEKINVMRNHYGVIVDFTISDLETGTLVTLKISLNDN